jgi:hypothetical protein
MNFLTLFLEKLEFFHNNIINCFINNYVLA